jgi:hypothetical protein
MKGGEFQFRNLKITELGYSSLFNGKDLAGWEGGVAPAESCWLVQEGLLVCNGQKGPWLKTLAEYGDFDFRFEYQVSPGGNSGVYVRVPADGNHHRENDTLPAAGFEVQVLDDSAPQYAQLKDYQYCGSVYDICGAQPRVCRAVGHWNTMSIRCEGQHVTDAQRVGGGRHHRPVASADRPAEDPGLPGAAEPRHAGAVPEPAAGGAGGIAVGGSATRPEIVNSPARSATGAVGNGIRMAIDGLGTARLCEPHPEDA